METTDITALVFDHGLFVELARRLARDYKRVLYHTPWERGFPLVNECVIGRGFDDIERCDDFWPLLDEIDLFIFPDIQHSGLQLYLESIGKRVWGSRDGDSLELNRSQFLKTLGDLGLPQPGYKNIMGLDDLRAYLKDNEDKYVKLSRYRGSMETWHSKDYKSSESMLDILAVRFGAVKNAVPFVVVDAIDTPLEVGYDGYCIDGQFPSLALQGYEAKDRAFICTVQKYEDLPKEVTVVNDAFAPLLQQYRYRNFFSTEIRVKDEQSYFIDPCCRCPSPSTESQLELYDNLGEIILAGSEGELVDQVVTAKFSVEAVMCIQSDKQTWITVEVPEEVRKWTKIFNSCQIEGRIACPPDSNHEEEVGWMLGLGNTIEEAIDHLKENVELLGDCRVKVDDAVLVDLLKEIHTAEEQDIEFSKQETPSPESVIKE